MLARLHNPRLVQAPTRLLSPEDQRDWFLLESALSQPRTSIYGPKNGHAAVTAATARHTQLATLGAGRQSYMLTHAAMAV